MNEIFYILPRGLVIGLLISAPMGPVGMLVIQRTLGKGRLPGLFTGLGASLSDLIYCLLTGFCMSFMTDFLDRNQLAIQIVGSVVIAAFGYYLLRKNPTRALKAADVKATNYWSDFVTGFLLTVSNPLILFFIIGLYARFSFFLPEFSYYHYVVAYLTILGGAVLWWWLVTMLVNRLGKRINVRALRLINAIIGLLLMAMAALGLGMALYDILLNS